MRKLLIILLILFTTITGIVIGSATDKLSSADTPACQYSERPLNPDGSCDNSDPCDPTTIKDPALHGDCSPKIEEPAPVVQPIARPKASCIE